VSGVVIIGAGHAGVGAAFELRQLGFAGAITVLDRSRHVPYERPPISKSWVMDTVGPESLCARGDGAFEAASIELRLGVEVRTIDRSRRVVSTSEGDVAYDKLILALGASPRQLPLPGRELEGVHALHTLEDALVLRESLRRAERLVVVGGGFIGLELASLAASFGLEVTVIETAHRLMARATSETTSAYMRARHEAAGVRIRTAVGVEGFAGSDGRLEGVLLADGTAVETPLALLGVGVVPNGSWLADVGLEFDNGVIVDAELRTGDPHIFAIGDCARYPDDEGVRLRLESVGNAADHARRVAGILAGGTPAGMEIPWFWTKQVGVRLQMVGRIERVDEWLLAGSMDSGAFSVIGLRGGILVYGESVNKPGDHVLLRKTLAAGPFTVDARVRDLLGDGLKPAFQAAALAGVSR